MNFLKKNKSYWLNLEVISKAIDYVKADEVTLTFYDNEIYVKSFVSNGVVQNIGNAPTEAKFLAKIKKSISKEELDVILDNYLKNNAL